MNVGAAIDGPSHGQVLQNEAPYFNVALPARMPRYFNVSPPKEMPFQQLTYIWFRDQKWRLNEASQKIWADFVVKERNDA